MRRLIVAFLLIPTLLFAQSSHVQFAPWTLNSPTVASSGLTAGYIAWWQPQSINVTNTSNANPINNQQVHSWADSSGSPGTNTLFESGGQWTWFAGTNGAPGFLEVAAGGSLCATNTTIAQPCTVQWVAHFGTVAQAGFNYVFDYGSGSGARHRAYMDGSGTGKMDTDSGAAPVLGPTTAIANGWHMVTIIVNGASSAIYLDSNSTPIAGPGDSGANGINGYRAFNNIGNALGWADYVGEGLLYNIGLSTTQIAANYTWIKANHFSFLP